MKANQGANSILNTEEFLKGSIQNFEPGCKEEMRNDFQMTLRFG